MIQKHNMKKLSHVFFVLLCTLALLPAAQADEITYFIPDASGSPVAAMNEAGTIIWRKHYTPFGADTKQENGITINLSTMIWMIK